MPSPLDSRPRLLVDPRDPHRYTAWFSSPIPRHSLLRLVAAAQAVAPDGTQIHPRQAHAVIVVPQQHVRREVTFCP